MEQTYIVELEGELLRYLVLPYELPDAVLLMKTLLLDVCHLPTRAAVLLEGDQAFEKALHALLFQQTDQVLGRVKYSQVDREDVFAVLEAADDLDVRVFAA